MGIIKFFKELSNFTKIVTDAAQAASEESAELPVLHANMDDDTLFETAVERIDILVELNEEDAENAPLTLPQRYCYALNLLELEVNNGGLCQFFVNSSRLAAPGSAMDWPPSAQRITRSCLTASSTNTTSM